LILFQDSGTCQQDKKPFMNMHTCASQDILSEIVTKITGDLYDYVMDRNASHVVRRLLCVIAGRNLIDGKNKGRAESDFGSKVERLSAMFSLSLWQVHSSFEQLG
jgi:hypothetical protein